MTSVPAWAAAPSARTAIAPGTPMWKAVPPRLVGPYLTGQRTVLAGYVYRAQDVRFHNPAEAYLALSLGWEDSEFTPHMSEIYLVAWLARARQLGLLGDRPGGLRGRGGPAGHRRPDRGAGGLPAVFGHVLAVDEEVPGAMCLVKADGGFEVFSRTDDAQLDVRFFEDEEAAYFYLFGVLAAEAVRSGRLQPGAPNGHVNGSRGRGVFSPHGKRFEVRTAQEVTQIGTSSSYR